MMFHGLTKEQATINWQSFQDWVNANPVDYSWAMPLTVAAIPAQHLWNPAFLRKYAAALIALDDRPGAPTENIFWAGDKEESGQFLHAYHSAWLPQELLEQENRSKLAAALFAASRHWTVSLHFNKGLAGAPEVEIENARNTAINPAVLGAFALVIVAGGGDPSFPGIAGHEPDITEARKDAENIDNAFKELTRILPNVDSYVSESNFFEKNWQSSYWGGELSEIKSS
jgi:hypothetical protein